MTDRTCCICYENVPCTHPRTLCCKQPIHTHCLHKCRGKFNTIPCPMCRKELTRYPNTRSNEHIQSEIRNFIASWDNSRGEIEKAFSLASFINFIYDNQHVVKTCYNYFWDAVNEKVKELDNFIIDNPWDDAHQVEYMFILNVCLRCQHNVQLDN